jgi:transposase
MKGAMTGKPPFNDSAVPRRSSELVLYQTDDGRARLQVRWQDDALWLTQLQMAELFQTTKQNISLHVRNILEDNELPSEATVKKYLTVQAEGGRQVERRIEHYHLDLIIAVGYRVRSPRGTQFRRWATRTFGVSRTSIYTWLDKVAQRGLRALKSEPRGRPRKSRLAGWQAANVVRLIEGGCPDQLRLPFALWTRQAVRQLLSDRFGLEVSIWTGGRYLAHWGLTPQKPLRRAYEQNPAAVQRWLGEEYPAIHWLAQREKAEIHWGDERGLRSDHSAVRLQHDLDDNQPGATGVHGLPGAVHGPGLYSLSAAPGAAQSVESVSDRGSSSGTSVGGRAAAGGVALRRYSPVLLAGLQSGTES